MKLKAILLILSLLAVFSVATCGALIFVSYKSQSLENAINQATNDIDKLEKILSNFLEGRLDLVKGLSGLDVLANCLLQPGIGHLQTANAVLDHVNTSMADGVVYLLDERGTAVASSNRHAPDSVVGKSYRFLTLFKKAITGHAVVDMSPGASPDDRCIYYGHPISAEQQGDPVGVIVMKTSAESIENEFIKAKWNGPAAGIFITSPEGIIFLTDHSELLFHAVWEISESQHDATPVPAVSRGEPLKWSGYTRLDRSRVVDRSGTEYLFFERPISHLPDWKIMVWSIDVKSYRKPPSPLFAPLFTSVWRLRPWLHWRPLSFSS